MSRACPQPQQDVEHKACYVCGSTEHLSRFCPESRKQSKAKACNLCGSMEHLQGACPTRPQVAICFNCGMEIGSEAHPLKACTQPKRTSGVCYAFRHGLCTRKNCKFVHEGKG